MLSISVKKLEHNTLSFKYEHKKCGHTQIFSYITPFICQRYKDEGCREYIPQVHLLYSDIEKRIDYFSRGVII